MTKAQLDRMVAIRVEVEITMSAYEEREITLADLHDLLKKWPVGSMRHAAYATCIAIIQE